MGGGRLVCDPSANTIGSRRLVQPHRSCETSRHWAQAGTEMVESGQEFIGSRVVAHCRAQRSKPQSAATGF